ncbi:PEP-CTERM sorting domain-containing protein [Thalassotalea eurytherma]
MVDVPEPSTLGMFLLTIVERV